jgi:chromosome segregation ATPase
MNLSEEALEQLQTQLRYKDEIMMDALRKRDAQKLATQEYKNKLDEARVQLTQAQLKIETLNKEMIRITNENRDLDAFNKMLQRMIKRMGTKK